MSSNFSSFAMFSPNSDSANNANILGSACLGRADNGEDYCRDYQSTFCLIAGDAKTALYVHLKNVRCKEGASEEDPSTWKSLNIAGYKFITMYARNIDDHSLNFTLHGYPVAPLKNGNVVFLFHKGVLDCISGEWEGEVEIEYKTGRIVTAIEWVKFLINEDFSGHGSRDGHPKCEDKIDHMPEIPGIQQLPLFGDDRGGVVTQLPSGSVPFSLGIPVPSHSESRVYAGTTNDALISARDDMLRRHGVIK